METKPRQVLYSPVDIDDADFLNVEDLDPQLEAENEEFEKFKSEMHDAQDDAKITVSKKMTDTRGRPMGRKTYECFECGIDDYTFSQLCTRIREDFGTGIYKIQGRDSNGKFKFGKSIGIVAPVSNDVTNPATDVGALFDKFSDAMQRQQMQTEAMFTKLVGPRTGGDAIDQIVKIAGAVAPILATLGLSRAEPVAPKTLVEQLTEFKMIKELFGGDESGGLGGGGDANLYSLLSETVRAFGGPIAAAIAAGAESGELTPEGLATTGRIEAPKPKTDEVMEQERHNMAMRKNIHILIQNAKTGIDPEAFALILVNNTPEEKSDELWDFISAEKCVDTIIALEPAAEAYRKWFDELRLAVIDLMADPEKDLQDETGESSLAESQTVAGESESPGDDASKSDSNPATDT
jgi:hypothetical protein